MTDVTGPDGSNPTSGLARALLECESIGADRFAINLGERVAEDEVEGIKGQTFGGIVAAQGLHAAFATVGPERRAQSAHAQFVARARSDATTELVVERDSDTRAFSTRRVVVSQEGTVVMTLTCAFHRPEETPEQLRPIPVTSATPPSSHEAHVDFGGLLELRRDLIPGDDHESPRVGKALWVRAREAVADDPVLRDCLLLCVSDIGTPWHVARPDGCWVGPTLNHSVWFHRRTDLAGWHYVHHEVEALTDARGLYVGGIWDELGQQAATVVQEQLVRVNRAPA
jgi:acyl-CoA thioesterase-2